MAMSINASIMASQPAAMIPQAQVTDANRIVENSRKSASDNRIAEQNSEALNSIPSRRIPSTSSVSQEKTSSSTDPAQQTQEERSAQQQIDSVISQLKARDREVRAHEQAHLSAAGSYATSGASYSYQTGPDGKRYAIGGEVGIDTSPIANDPEATLQKAMIVQQAALAPAQPSTQDLRVASAASQMINEARAEILEQQQAEMDSTSSLDESETQENSGSTVAANQIDNQVESPANQIEPLQSDSIKQNPGLQQLAMERSQFETRLTLSNVFA